MHANFIRIIYELFPVTLINQNKITVKDVIAFFLIFVPIFLIIISVLPLDFDVIRKNQNTLLLVSLFGTIFIWPIPLWYIVTKYEKQAYRRWKSQGGVELKSIIDEKIHLSNLQPDEIFDSCLSWLKKERVRVKIENRPSRIFAVYRANTEGFIRDYSEASKEIEILIRKEDDGVQLQILMDSPGRKGPWRIIDQEFKVQWKTLVEDFYRHIGAYVDTDVLTRLYEPSTLKDLIIDHKKREKSDNFLGIGIIIISILLGIVSENQSLFWGVILAFMLFWNADYHRQKMNDYKSKIDLLYEEENN